MPLDNLQKLALEVYKKEIDSQNPFETFSQIGGIKEIAQSIVRIVDLKKGEHHLDIAARIHKDLSKVKNDLDELTRQMSIILDRQMESKKTARIWFDSFIESISK